MTEVTYITGYNFFCWWHACSFYHLNYLPILNSKDFKVSNMLIPPPPSVNVMLGEDHWNLREQFSFAALILTSHFPKSPTHQGAAGQVTFRAVRTASSLLARFRSWTQGNNCSAQQWDRQRSSDANSSPSLGPAASVSSALLFRQPSLGGFRPAAPLCNWCLKICFQTPRAFPFVH